MDFLKQYYFGYVEGKNYFDQLDEHAKILAVSASMVFPKTRSMETDELKLARVVLLFDGSVKNLKEVAESCNNHLELIALGVAHDVTSVLKALCSSFGTDPNWATIGPQLDCIVLQRTGEIGRA